MVGGNRRLEGMPLLLAPARQQPVDADRIDDGAGKDVRADLTALFQNDDGKLGIDLLEPDRRGKAGRPRADDDDVEFHALAFDVAHQPLRTGLSHPGILLAYPLHSASIRDGKPALA